MIAFTCYQVPTKWRKLLGGSAATLMQWKADTEAACNLLIKYLDKDSKPVAYNLSAFVDSKLFIQSLLVQHARRELVDVNDLYLHTKVSW